MSVNIPIYGEAFKKKLLNLAVLRASAQSTPDMTVQISAGTCWSYTSTGLKFIEYSGGSSDALTASILYPKWCIVAINCHFIYPDPEIVILEGDEALNPNFPEIPAGRYPLAAIYITRDTVQITDDIIYDVRPIFELGLREHSDLEGLTTGITHTAGNISYDESTSGIGIDNVQDALDYILLSGTSSSSGTSGTSGNSIVGPPGNSGTSGTSGNIGNPGTSGTSGYAGTSGTSGTSGINGTSGTSGTNGTSGTSSTSGTSGSSGSSGRPGIDGLSGTDGTSGTSGNTGTSGTSGNTGTSGTSGNTGTSGTDGTSGTSSTSGTSGDGTSGTSGDGTSGTSGTSSDGTSGTSGSAGTSGISATDGTSGTSSTSGTSGDSGTSGTSGDSGTSGTSGDSGTSGTSGDSGTSGTSGSAGTSGTDGTSGTSSTSGTSGDGTSGTSGDSGTSGTSGTSSDGTSGTSGDSGTSGIDGTSGTSSTSGTSGDGTSGTSGDSGTSGTSGDSGTSGTSSDGTSGTSGDSGTSGTDGTSGTSSTSGTSGDSGTSGTSGIDGTNFGTSGTSCDDWVLVPGANYTAAPASSSTITMGVDMTSTIFVGYPLRYIISGVTYYGIVPAITSGLLSVAGAPLGGSITSLYWGLPSKVTQFNINVPANYEASSCTTLIATNLKMNLLWQRAQSYCVKYTIWSLVKDTSSDGKATVMLNGADVNSAAGGLTIAASATLYSTVVNINTTNYGIANGQAIEINVTKGTTGDATDLTATLVFVTP